MRMLTIFALLFAFLAPFGTVPASAARPAFDSLIKEYRGIFIGTSKDAVRQKLGDPKNEFPEEDDFEISDNENVRIFYNPEKEVKAIVVTFSGNISGAPSPKDVVGEAIEPRPDGGMYKMVRAEEKGFWVSYVKIAGDAPSVIITVQSLPKAS